jgi:hypothetical protein
VWVVFIHLLRFVPSCTASVACSQDEDCVSALREGSKCGADGLCTNPFHYGGCLANYLPDSFKHTKRVCGSDDPPEAFQNGYCRSPQLEYMEIRIAIQNWEAAFFDTWILQILLSELLGVPTSIETGVPGLNTDFYSISSALDYGTSNDYEALRLAGEVGDCRKLKEESDDTGDEEYQACAHVIPECWDDRIPNEEYVERHEMGALGVQNWFIPKFTAEQDLTLLSYLGLQGATNRRKMAELFKRPTSWKDYCELVSVNKCKTSDGVAARAPRDEAEETSMFVDGLYTGHFRATEDNDCDKNPETCTGHIADWPCGWTTYAKPIAHHLKIALSSNGPEASDGYSYAQLTQIWAAANATKSPVIMEWWSPEALYQTFLDTDAEFMKVVLPPPTQTCINHRISVDDRCGDDGQMKLGDPRGACDYQPLKLDKMLSRNLRELSFDPSIPEALWSPSYDAIKAFRVTELEQSNFLTDWLERGVDKWNFDPRDAACQWVVENLELVQSFIPQDYPRVIQEVNNTYNRWLIS